MPVNDRILTNRHLSDINPLIAGEEACEPGHSFGPAVRRYTLIHYVLRGKGMYYAYGNAYPVEAGQAFLILPDEVTTYAADREDPWHYQWIGFEGGLSEKFRKLPPVFPVPDMIFRDIFQRTVDKAMLEYWIARVARKIPSMLPNPTEETSRELIKDLRSGAKRPETERSRGPQSMDWAKPLMPQSGMITAEFGSRPMPILEHVVSRRPVITIFRAGIISPR